MAEQRSTRSWELSIYNACYHINRTNKRRRSGGVYLRRAELAETLYEAYPLALKRAALETFGGQYEAQELATLIDQTTIEQNALSMVLEFKEG